MIAEPPRTAADVAWRMFGIPVRVHPYFWIASLVLGWNSVLGVDGVLVWTAVTLVSVLIHELGHALTARAFGARDLRIVLHALGGLAIHAGGVLRRSQRVLELFMGPGAGFLLALAVWLAGRTLVDDASFLVRLAYYDLLWVNLAWGAVNLLPVFPLDGGQVLVEVLQARRPDGLLVGLKVSMVVAILVAAVVEGLFLTRGLFGGTTFVMFLFLALMNWQVLQQAKAARLGGDRLPFEREPWEADPDAWKR